MAPAGRCAGRDRGDRPCLDSCPLLEASGEPVDTVAARAGFGSAEAMRAFQNTLGVSPTVYRARLRTTVPG